MTISVTGKLNEAAKEYPNNSGVNFLVRIGVKVYDFKLKDNVWVNYSGFIFVNKDAQINFYRGALVDGAIVELKGSDVIPEVYGEQNKVTLKVQDPKLGYIGTVGNQQSTPHHPQSPQNNQMPNGGYNNNQNQQYGQQQQAPQQQPNNMANMASDFDDIPF